MTEKEKKIEAWCAEVQNALDRLIDMAPNAACRDLVHALLKETYGWPEYPE